MKTAKFTLLGLLIFCICGCARNYYNVPRETFEKKVRVLGVAPIMVDPTSDIRHPEKDLLVSVVKDYNRKNERELVSMLRETGTFFTVRPVEGDPDQLFNRLVFRHERRNDGGVVYNKYFVKGDELKSILSANGLDALMLVYVSGITKQDKLFSSNLIKYLDTDYNYLLMSAQILDENGSILWEYPNFLSSSASSPVFVELQYPDFDEANANMSDATAVKFKTIPGITRFLDKKEKDFLLRTRPVSSVYYHLFDDMVSLLKPQRDLFGFGEKKEAPAAPEAPAPAAPVSAAPAPAPAAAPPAPAPPASEPKPEPIQEQRIQELPLK